MCRLILMIGFSVLTLCACQTQDGESPAVTINGLDDFPGLHKRVSAIMVQDTLASDKKHRIRQSLKSKGYYDGRIQITGDRGVKVQPGAPVTISDISITPKTYKPYLEKSALKTNDVLDAARVLKAQSVIMTAIDVKSCSLRLNVTHRAIFEGKKHARLVYYVEEGEPAVFGDLNISGQSSVEESYIRRIIGWQKGKCFRRSILKDIKKRLMATGLFARVDVDVPDAANKNASVPIVIKIEERPHRTVSAGLSYYTDEGVGAVFGWEHRNILGRGEHLETELKVARLEQSLSANVRKPYFKRDDQILALHSGISHEDTDAYEKLGADIGGSVTRDITKDLSIEAGLDFEFARIKEDNEDEENFGLLSPFSRVTYDSRDDPLDANKGVLLSGLVRPSFETLGESKPFIKLVGTGQHYYALDKKLVLASRVKLGSVMGTTTEDLPATKRFYAGGGGSVRGFGYQNVGPIEDDGDPAGGRSLAEGAIELRYKFNKTYGAVAFYDAGQVSDDVFPDLSTVSTGAGLGFRYYTDFGPLRVDVGVPVSGKRDSDDDFQVYISIGQAF